MHEKQRAPCSAARLAGGRWTLTGAPGAQEYFTSGFLSLQAAVDAYALGLRLPAALDTSLIAPPGANGSARAGAPAAGFGQGPAGLAGLAAWTQWGVVMPTSAYTHNDFYVRGPGCTQSANLCTDMRLQPSWMICSPYGVHMLCIVYHVWLPACQPGAQSSPASSPC
jgi:hypothetical protein